MGQRITTWNGEQETPGSCSPSLPLSFPHAGSSRVPSCLVLATPLRVQTVVSHRGSEDPRGEGPRCGLGGACGYPGCSGSKWEASMRRRGDTGPVLRRHLGLRLSGAPLRCGDEDSQTALLPSLRTSRDKLLSLDETSDWQWEAGRRCWMSPSVSRRHTPQSSPWLLSRNVTQAACDEM